MPYRRTQIGWLVLVPLGVGGLLALSSLASAGLFVGAATTFAVLAILAAIFATLTIEVDREALRFRFGVGLVRRRIALADILTWRRVRNPWYSGWGVRMYGRGLLYNVSGFDAVELQLRDGSQLRLGTADPAGLCDALAARLGPPPAVTAAEAAVAGKAQRNLALAFGLALVLLFAGIGLLFRAQLQPVKLAVDDAGFGVDDAVYDARVPWSAVTAVELVERMPPLSLRTNGFALGATLRGHFRSPELGSGRVYVRTDRPPFVLVRTTGHDRFVVLNDEDPARTRDAFARLDAAWRRVRPAP